MLKVYPNHDSPTALEHLAAKLKPLRERLVEHELYRRMQTLHDLQIFMQHHVFAVWDFMSLLKTLQRHLTCTDVPWIPRGDNLSRRLINDIVLGEESDEDGSDGYTSHFEMYRTAMQQCGAETATVDEFVQRITQREPVLKALKSSGAPPASQVFVRTTWEIIQADSIPAATAAFALGREELIPDMFRALVADLQEKFPSQLSLYQYYLERHIGIDEDHHTPLALRMLSIVCGNDDTKWHAAEIAATKALDARIALWDGVIQEINRQTKGVMTTGRAGGLGSSKQ